MADDITFGDFTAAEKLRIVALGVRAAKRGLADNGTGNVDISDIKRRIERIENAARRRKHRK